MPIDLNRWHHAVNQVSGSMALRFNRATMADLAHWAKVCGRSPARWMRLPSALKRPHQRGSILLN